MVPYRHEPEDRKESHDETSLKVSLVTKQDSDQPMIYPGPCHGDTTRYQVLTVVLLLLGRDVVTICKWLQTSVCVYS